jgi:hypothetical protein
MVKKLQDCYLCVWNTIGNAKLLNDKVDVTNNYHGRYTQLKGWYLLVFMNGTLPEMKIKMKFCFCAK